MESLVVEIETSREENTDFTPPSQQTENNIPKRENGITYSCNYPNCSQTFSSPTDITRHIAGHSEDRPYVCDQCNKGFKRADHLSAHSNRHTAERPYKCPVDSCQITFKSKAGLKYHIDTHNNKERFRCDHPGCDKAFVKSWQLKEHKAVGVHESLPVQMKPIKSMKPTKPSKQTKMNPYVHKEREYSEEESEQEGNGVTHQHNKSRLLRNINKMLSENRELKQQLKICQKTISIHQARLEEFQDIILQ